MGAQEAGAQGAGAQCFQLPEGLAWSRRWDCKQVTKGILSWGLATATHCGQSRILHLSLMTDKSYW